MVNTIANLSTKEFSYKDKVFSAEISQFNRNSHFRSGDILNKGFCLVSEKTQEKEVFEHFWTVYGSGEDANEVLYWLFKPINEPQKKGIVVVIYND